MTYRPERPSYHSLFRGADLDLTDVHCAGHDGGEESVESLKLVFVRRGVFEKESPGRVELVDPATVIVFFPGEPYRIRHPLGCGDRCTSIGVGERLLDELEVSPARLARTSVRVGAPEFALQRRLLAAAGQDEFLLEEELLAMVARLLAELLGTATTGEVVSARCRAHRELAQAVRLHLAAHYGRSETLSDIAALHATSSFHLCRVFKAHVGVPIHRYRHALRMHAALEQLGGGVSDLTRLALELGFSSHSHFSDCFRRAFGVPPSRWRSSMSGPVATGA